MKNLRLAIAAEVERRTLYQVKYVDLVMRVVKFTLYYVSFLNHECFLLWFRLKGILLCLADAAVWGRYALLIGKQIMPISHFCNIGFGFFLIYIFFLVFPIIDICLISSTSGFSLTVHKLKYLVLVIEIPEFFSWYGVLYETEFKYFLNTVLRMCS